MQGPNPSELFSHPPCTLFFFWVGGHGTVQCMYNVYEKEKGSETEGMWSTIEVKKEEEAEK